MKFQDDISNMNTYIHTYGQAETNMSPTFSNLGNKKRGGGGGGGGGGGNVRQKVASKNPK